MPGGYAEDDRRNMSIRCEQNYSQAIGPGRGVPSEVDIDTIPEARFCSSSTENRKTKKKRSPGRRKDGKWAESISEQ